MATNIEEPTATAASAEHWGLDDPVGCLDPAQELETLELGDRVGWWLTLCQGAGMYSTAADRERSMTLVLVGQVATATRESHEPFPSDWEPAASNG